MAVLGGLLLIAVAASTVYSILARAVPDLPLLGNWRPIRGNFELVEMATAVAIFAFLPYTQMRRGHVRVDFFTNQVGPRTKAALAVVADALLSAIALLFAWRMSIATVELYTAPYTQTTMLLGLPLWWGYLPSSVFMILFSLTALASLWRSLAEVLGEGGRGEAAGEEGPRRP